MASQANLVESWFVLMARPSKPDMPPKPTKNGTIRYLPHPNSAQVSMIDIVAISGR